jgi:hypothetical protein
VASHLLLHVLLHPLRAHAEGANASQTESWSISAPFP